jgi:hypothetical protein
MQQMQAFRDKPIKISGHDVYPGASVTDGRIDRIILGFSENHGKRDGAQIELVRGADGRIRFTGREGGDLTGSLPAQPEKLALAAQHLLADPDYRNFAAQLGAKPESLAAFRTDLRNITSGAAPAATASSGNPAPLRPTSAQERPASRPGAHPI